MITYSENAVKLIKLQPEEKVMIMIYHTGQVLIVPISLLEHTRKMELVSALFQLRQEAQEYQSWQKLNG